MQTENQQLESRIEHFSKMTDLQLSGLQYQLASLQKQMEYLRKTTIKLEDKIHQLQIRTEKPPRIGNFFRFIKSMFTGTYEHHFR